MTKKEFISNLKIDLFSKGVRISAEDKGRKGGAGPAGSKNIIFGNTVANVPTFAKFVADSPYSLDNNVLKKFNEKIIDVKIPNPQFYKLKTKDGIPYNKIALLHGEDCLATTVVQHCIYWDTPLRCKFCGIDLSKGSTLDIKKPEEIAEVAEAAKRLDNVKHVTLTIGALKEEDEIKILGNCASAIKNAAKIPVHVQFEPLKDLKRMENLYSKGVDTVGIHIESFDKKVLENIAPAKAKIGFDRYLKALEYAVNIFGENQVSSFIIIGLGESDESVIEGCKTLAGMGIYPFVVPINPIPGSYMEDAIPPSFERMKDIYESVASILKENLSWKKSKAGCVKCRACSALDVFE
ncbi:MSMEG_0568 family radical SAM protein [Candidatus Methanoliparum sp. LAM-1]|uniref:MSMEG_0568 family radical SAM protein n=1 Tax=Candidatus Methanoliparum sp. LAM-1 TaxID=2874846 RepID=UPI001E387AD5|nr:MSMEG_0568 family radical SAM protein [Candidatus Methanoliparum sp. LAM-1]BDC35939.1 radical SAM protein [Candidatus Methanoliparum sp. LAM-1]